MTTRRSTTSTPGSGNDSAASSILREIGHAIKKGLTWPVKMWAVLIGGAIFVLLYAAVERNVTVLAQDQIVAAQVEEARADYEAATDDYNRDLQARAVCLSRVETSAANRAQHQLIVDTIRGLLPGSETAEAFADELEAGPLLGSEPLSAADCPAEPVRPVLPPELNGAP